MKFLTHFPKSNHPLPTCFLGLLLKNWVADLMAGAETTMGILQKFSVNSAQRQSIRRPVSKMKTILLAESLEDMAPFLPRDEFRENRDVKPVGVYAC